MTKILTLLRSARIAVLSAISRLRFAWYPWTYSYGVGVFFDPINERVQIYLIVRVFSIDWSK